MRVMVPRADREYALLRGQGGPGSAEIAQIVTTGQVMVRVMPSICYMSRTTKRPRSSMEAASARAITS